MSRPVVLSCWRSSAFPPAMVRCRTRPCATRSDMTPSRAHRCGRTERRPGLSRRCRRARRPRPCSGRGDSTARHAGGARAGSRTLRHLLLALSRPGRKRRRHGGPARLSKPALVSHRASPRRAGPPFLRCDHRRLWRHVLLRVPGRAGGPLGHHRLYPRTATLAACPGRTLAGPPGEAAMTSGRARVGWSVAAVLALAAPWLFAPLDDAARGWLVGFALLSGLPLGSRPADDPSSCRRTMGTRNGPRSEAGSHRRAASRARLPADRDRPLAPVSRAQSPDSV